MLRLIGFFLKVSLFSIIVLILGNLVRWEGRTISDQVKTQMAHAERSSLLGEIRHWAEQLTREARKGGFKKLHSASSDEEFPSSERQKLKTLIQELNNSRKID